MQHPTFSHILVRLNEAAQRLNASTDLPELLTEMEYLGISHCHTYLADGSTCYYGPSFYRLEGPAMWSWSPVCGPADAKLLAHFLDLHHAGSTDRKTFLRQAAEAGADVLTTNVGDRSVTYLDLEGRVMAVEPIVAHAARYN